MVRITGNVSTGAGVAICGAVAIYFPTSVNANQTTSPCCGIADTSNSAGVFQDLAAAADKYDIRVNTCAAFQWVRYADEIQHATYQTGDGCACGLEGNYYVGLGNDAGIRWSTADASNHAMVIGVGNTSQQVHITDEAAMNTDWARTAGTHPELAIHSNTTPATDYLALGNHDGTTATVDVVGGTTLALAIGGTKQAHVDADGVCVITGNFYAINNVSVLNATTLGASVVSSSLTTVGTIGTGVWAGTDVTVPNGGTGAGTFTDHGVMLGSGVGALSVTSAGTCGQVLISGGACADPDWGAVAGSTNLVLIGTVVPNSEANLSVTGLDSTYDTYLLLGSNVVPETDGATFVVRVGDACGVDASACDYAYHTQFVHSGCVGYAGSVSTSNTGIHLAPAGTGNACGEGIGFALWLHRPGDGTMRPTISGTYSSLSAGTVIYGGMVTAQRAAVITLDRVDISFNSGDIAAGGRFSVYGVKHA